MWVIYLGRFVINCAQFVHAEKRENKMEEPKNETPEAVTGIYEIVAGILSSYGWTILFILVIINLLWSHFYPKWRKWKDRLEDEQRNQEYQQNPDLILEREEGLRRARLKLQEEHERLAQAHEEKVKQREEEKRREKVRLYEQFQAGKSSKRPDDKPQTLRSEFNPLTGSSSGSCYRPARRSAVTGGG